MLSKSHRLKTEEVELVMTKGKSLFSDFFLIKLINIKTQENPRGLKHYPLKVSAIASKKTFPTAVLRNKARRRAYSALSNILTTHSPLVLNGKRNTDSFLIALICNKKVLSEKISTISANIEQVFKKGGIL